ncbi:MAG TPA: M18 family aminopeptidase [Pseudomonadales bacterium]|nr:M18 family aminopeptidase [Pseudomonadales bacterium]
MLLAPFNQALMNFIRQSPTPFHAVQTLANALRQAGFEALNESDSWALQAPGKYFVCRNDSSIIAFKLGTEPLAHSGFKMVGAHTDSPCLKVKPQAILPGKAYLQVGVEVYGGVLLNPWFDRDLSLAGRVSYRNKSGQLCNALINFEKALAIIPSLAIHLDRSANQERSVNNQKDLPPVLALLNEKTPSFEQLLTEQLKRQGVDDVDKILAHELCFYDTQPPQLLGLNDDFIASARLDNLLSCFTGLQALLETPDSASCLLMCSDHEEVGSTSACGAQGSFLLDVLARLHADSETRIRCNQRSMLISADNAHGLHPNHVEKHDANHGPILNKGPVIKVNSSQRYASNSETVALFRHLAETVQVPVQSFVVRSDMGCGSTIGPLVAAETGIKTIDIGVPTFAMHSIRELAGAEDAHALYRILKAFFVS